MDDIYGVLHKLDGLLTNIIEGVLCDRNDSVVDTWVNAVIDWHFVTFFIRLLVADTQL